MKVVVDPDICLGCGVCESIAPNIFILGDEVYAKVIMNPVPEQLRDVVEEAVSECPEEAISIIEDED
ncbi:MAG: ferredoxin [Chloroflexi bacterium HGW-Chloroflexi-10]|nr:MAG: ferredoxin [Chloroflexi bacterium HGW-Chloroflexi-10]